MYIPEIGHFALILALCVASSQFMLPVYSYLTHKDYLLALIKWLALGQAGLVIFAYLILTYAFYTNDFTLPYVAHNSLSALPGIYKITAVWGAHEGSLLLWITLLSIWTIVFIGVTQNKLPRLVLAQVLGVLGLLNIGFLAFIEFTSNPFIRDIIGAPLEGYDLNPLLQDPGMVSHPPMLYMGYVGFALVFALAIVSLLNARLDKKWLYFMRIWALFAWSFLTIGITLGSFWSYYVLGWGGFWFWDPVENASFMPWLTGTALLHSLMLSEKTNLFKNWTILLAIITFALSLVGTFIVRSGVISSVHAFAADPSRGIFILILLLIVIGGSLALYALRSNLLSNQQKMVIWSREMFMVLGNLILTVLAATVFLGTIYPLVLDVFDLGKISVGPPYFNMLFIPLFLVLAIMAALGPFTKWGIKADKIFINLIVITVIIFLLTWPYTKLNLVAGILVGAWVCVFSCYKFWQKLTQNNYNILQLSGGFWGMFLAHISVGLVILAIALATSLSSSVDVKLALGKSAQVGGYSFNFYKLKDKAAAENYNSIAAVIKVTKNNKLVTILQPEKRYYTTPQIWQTHVAIDGGILRDLYIALGDQYPDGSWTFRIYVQPFIRILWLGGFLMACGGIVSALAKLRKLANDGN